MMNVFVTKNRKFVSVFQYNVVMTYLITKFVKNSLRIIEEVSKL